MISTRDLTLLPDVAGLKAVLQALAMLDAILSPEWQYRYYSFNSRWSRGEEMGSMRDGCGDDFFALFNRAGCFLKGFAHECPMSPYGRKPPQVLPGILDAVPKVFAACLVQPAFCMEDTTFCIWRRRDGKAWQRGPVQYLDGPDPDGSLTLLSPLEGRPERYQEWAEDHYERPISLAAVRHVHRHRPLTAKVVAALNKKISLADLAEDIAEIGYPTKRQ
jgi:hypothetical protein